MLEIRVSLEYKLLFCNAFMNVICNDNASIVDVHSLLLALVNSRITPSAGQNPVKTVVTCITSSAGEETLNTIVTFTLSNLCLVMFV